MAILPINPIPTRLPFDADDTTGDHFELFCLRHFAAGTSLPNFGLSPQTPDGPSRLRIVDAVRYGQSGDKQLGIDLLLRMENRERWVVQCKHWPRITEGEAEAAIEKAEVEYGSYAPAQFLLWVTGSVAPKAIEAALSRPNWTLWDGQRISTDFLLHAPRPQALDIITHCFGAPWAKAFFPLPDSLLISPSEFFQRWSEPSRLFHHNFEFVGRIDARDTILAFVNGGDGNRALIVSAAGGLGKTRLLRAAAEHLDGQIDARPVFFTNPDAGPTAEPNRAINFRRAIVFHDDAHRIETLPKTLLACLARAESGNSRLILSTRPGSEDVLRERLMEAGYDSPSIAPNFNLAKLTRTEMTELAAACLGSSDPMLARALANCSKGCALITMVGGNLIQRKELSHLDLIQDSNFTHEVFLRFEGEELNRLPDSVDRAILEKLLRCLALLSPWDRNSPQKAEALAAHLDLTRERLEWACDALIARGLALSTHDGLRLTPDLFSDHLVYTASYTEDGQLTDFIRSFLDHFIEPEIVPISKNLAEAEWRAIEQHGSTAGSVIDPIWKHFLTEFERASFSDRAIQMRNWSRFAVYQPERSIELAQWALQLDQPGQGDPERTIWDYGDHDHVLQHIPALLKPVAIWSGVHRRSALQTLWELHRDFPQIGSSPHRDPFDDFAEVANLKHNFPAAQTGILDWLIDLLDGPDGPAILDHRSTLLESVLRPMFSRIVEESYMSDQRTFVFQTCGVRLQAVQPLRQRALAVLNERVIPRGTVATINALSAIGAAFHPSDSIHSLPETAKRNWKPEHRAALDSLSRIATLHPHPFVHFAIRRQLHWNVTYGKDEDFRDECHQLIDSLPDTFELQLARLTLSWNHDDLFERHPDGETSEWYAKLESLWAELTKNVVSELVTRYSTGEKIHDFLVTWAAETARHGLQTHLGGLLARISTINEDLGFEILETIHAKPDSALAGYAGTLLVRNRDPLPPRTLQAIQFGLESTNPDLVRSMLNSIRYGNDLQTPSVWTMVAGLAEHSDPAVLPALFALVQSIPDKSRIQELVENLLSQPLDPEEVENLAAKIQGRLRFGRLETSDETLTMALDAVMHLPRLKSLSRHQPSFLREMILRQPRAVFDHLVRRIAEHQSGDSSDANFPDAAFFYDGPRFGSLKDDPEYESLARDLIAKIRNSQKDDLRPWIELFRAAVSQVSPLVETLLSEWLQEIDNDEELATVADLTGFEGSLIVFQFPTLTESILRSARKRGIASFDQISHRLIRGAGPKSRSYREGELDAEYLYLREAAEAAVAVHESNSILRPFYARILEIEIRDAEWHRRDLDSRMSEGW